MRAMRGRAALSLALLVASLAACSGNDVGVSTATVEISQGPRTFLYSVEIAASPSGRQRGLMDRRTLASNHGMLFLFPRDVAQGFWMKNTLISLDIAFIDDDRIVEIRSMVPCRRDPCPLTTPSSVYDAALELNEGSFTRAGITAGAEVRVRGILPKVS